MKLRTAVQKWPTPTVNDSKNSTLPKSQIGHGNVPGELLRRGESPGGHLNPMWVEWLMGFPIGWTSLEPMKTCNVMAWIELSSNGLWWDNDPANGGVLPRVLSGVKNRGKRLMALGNGQVPVTAAKAFNFSTEE